MAIRKQGNIIGERVRLARERSRPPVMQQDLVARLQVEGLAYMDSSKVSRVESGDRSVTDIEVVAFARSLRVSTSWLLGEESD